MKRVFPTGKCWCGCGEPTERTSFFVPGHDKRAEAKVVKEVYGSVVELLTAHGYGPDGRDPTAALPEGMDTTGLHLLEEWTKQGVGKVHVVLEFMNADNRSAPLCRAENFHPRYLAADRAVRFELCSAPKVSGCSLAIPTATKLTVPFPDVGWVYVERDEPNGPTRVVRLRGAIAADPVVRFLPFG